MSAKDGAKPLVKVRHRPGRTVCPVSDRGLDVIITSLVIGRASMALALSRMQSVVSDYFSHYRDRRPIDRGFVVVRFWRWVVERQWR